MRIFLVERGGRMRGTPVCAENCEWRRGGINQSPQDKSAVVV